MCYIIKFFQWSITEANSLQYPSHFTTADIRHFCRWFSFVTLKKTPIKLYDDACLQLLIIPPPQHRNLHIFTVYALHALWNASAFLKLKLPCVIINSWLQTEKKVIDRVSVLVLYLDWIVCLRSVWAVIAIQLGHFCKERREITPNHLNQTLFSLFIQD